MTQSQVNNVKTPLGWFRIEACEGAIDRIDLVASHGSSEWLTDPMLDDAARQLTAYFVRDLQTFSLPLAWGNVTGFRRDVLQVVAGSPFGELMSYGDIAKLVGKPGSAQAVGTAVGSNPWLIVVPCHRVIGADRKLHGYSAVGGLVTKTWLLEYEGHKLVGGKVSLKER